MNSKLNNPYFNYYYKQKKHIQLCYICRQFNVACNILQIYVWMYGSMIKHMHECVCVWLRASSGRSLRTHATDRNNGEAEAKQKRIMAAFACSFFLSLGAARPKLCVCVRVRLSVCMFALLSLIFTLIWVFVAFAVAVVFFGVCSFVHAALLGSHIYLLFFFCFVGARSSSSNKRCSKIVFLLLLLFCSYAKVNELFRCCPCISDVIAFVVVLR